jgi:hypothetical protein
MFDVKPSDADTKLRLRTHNLIGAFFIYIRILMLSDILSLSIGLTPSPITSGHFLNELHEINVIDLVVCCAFFFQPWSWQVVLTAKHSDP